MNYFFIFSIYKSEILEIKFAFGHQRVKFGIGRKFRKSAETNKKPYLPEAVSEEQLSQILSHHLFKIFKVFSYRFFGQLLKGL